MTKCPFAQAIKAALSIRSCWFGSGPLPSEVWPAVYFVLSQMGCYGFNNYFKRFSAIQKQICGLDLKIRMEIIKREGKAKAKNNLK